MLAWHRSVQRPPTLSSGGRRGFIRRPPAVAEIGAAFEHKTGKDVERRRGKPRMVDATGEGKESPLRRSD
jgi:hypothetical protein